MSEFESTIEFEEIENNLTNKEWFLNLLKQQQEQEGEQEGKEGEELEIKDIIVEDMSTAGGLSGALLRRLIIKLNKHNNQQQEEQQQQEQEHEIIKKYVIKSTKKGTFQQSKSLKLAREGEFYKLFKNELKSILAEVIFSYGDLETGSKLLIMEDLSDAVQTGYFFGPGSPLNWGKDLIKEQKTLHSIVTLDMVVEHSMMANARLNGLNWMRQSLLEPQYSFLRGQDWLLGHNENVWQGLHSNSTHSWHKTKTEKLNDPSYNVKWSPYIISLIDSSISKISWLHFQSRLTSTPWTLVHGDFHPANIMWKPNSSHNLMLLDWELVGLGSGAQDVGQYFISHLNPKQRKEIEENMVRIYYNQLISYGINEKVNHDLQYTWEMCWNEYIYGGIEKWIWLLALLSTMLPDPLMQYFHDQVEAFGHDHHVTPEKIGMPRL